MNSANEQYQKSVVSWAMAVFARLGLAVEWDNGNKVWDIETRDGWVTCSNWTELSKLAQRVQRAR